MSKKTEDVLLRRSLTRTVRSRVRENLLDIQDRVLNEVEQNALAEFDRLVDDGGDYAAYVDEVKSMRVNVAARMELDA